MSATSSNHCNRIPPSEINEEEKKCIEEEKSNEWGRLTNQEMLEKKIEKLKQFIKLKEQNRSQDDLQNQNTSTLSMFSSPLLSPTVFGGFIVDKNMNSDLSLTPMCPSVKEPMSSTLVSMSSTTTNQYLLHSCYQFRTHPACKDHSQVRKEKKKILTVKLGSHIYIGLVIVRYV